MTIRAMRRLPETTAKLGGRGPRASGDNWHMTWAADGSQFVGLCDGYGWPEIRGHVEKPYNSRIYRLHGDPPHPEFEHLAGFPDLLSERGSGRINRYYGFGILALDQRVYQFLSTPNTPFSVDGARFVGAKLIYSPASGETWKSQDGSPLCWEEWDDRGQGNMVFFEEPGEAFSLLTVLQMGRNYGDNADGFVYVYAPNGNVEGAMNQMVMFRVERDGLLDRGRYEFFVERREDGSARWSPRIEDRGVVHTFPSGWVNTMRHPYAWHPSVVYNAALGEYMMANWGMGSSDDGMWFGRPTYLGLWTAKFPWGPWTQVHEEEEWLPEGTPGARPYQPQISPRWIAADGRSFWLVWTDYRNVEERKPYYCFNYQKVELETD